MYYLFQENKSLLGGKIDIETSRVGTHDSHTSLLHENKKHGLSLTIQRSHSSVFHAGVIGEGLRRGEKQHVYLQVVLSYGLVFFFIFIILITDDP